MIRGVGDPLVAVYARCYLCRVAAVLDKNQRVHLMPTYLDFLTTFSQIRSERIQPLLVKNRIEMSVYMNLHSPALDWILQCVAYKASSSELKAILQTGREKSNSGILLHSILSAFQPDYIVSRSLEFAEMIKECKVVGISRVWI